MGSITRAEVLMGRDAKYPADFTKEISDNVDRLLAAVNCALAPCGLPVPVASGWRPDAVNDHTANAAKKSNHRLGLAVDIRDLDGKLWAWCLANMELLKEAGIWLEDPRWSPTWVHWQIVPPASGHRVYVPSSAPMPAPGRWDGRADPAWN